MEYRYNFTYMLPALVSRCVLSKIKSKLYFFIPLYGGFSGTANKAGSSALAVLLKPAFAFYTPLKSLIAYKESYHLGWGI